MVGRDDGEARAAAAASGGAGSPPIGERRAGEHVLVLTIDRPSRKNAFDRATAVALARALDRYETDDTLRAAVLTGAGGCFSAGQDLTAIVAEGIARDEARGGFGVMEVPPAKPLIAAVEGYAVGGGMEVCLSCDLVVAARGARFGMPEAARGLFAAGGGLFRLPRRIPYHLAMEACLTGELWPAQRYAELGLVNRVVDDGQALAAAIELAERIGRSGPVAVRATTGVIRRSGDWTDAEGWRRQMELGDAVFASEDFHEGIAAFAERREPVWRNR
ncbi:crotonase/enoyl-CoA hydratase family protein [Conexibacter arvalis]|uniref:Enoyl-CoA hydratase n=1 Tax=Conexibacter arvalis TaxID=912552 RepID=A0A840I906_9ACTN|nr:crotonase/enoyl-CoA hydratase family protein [Conexibacter arvalis]MBB4660624.1 enoyl-CoA hydratase [Conexibacter arvalis]